MMVQLGLGRNLRRIQAAMSDYTSAIAVEIAQDKEDTRRVLESVGLSVPAGYATMRLEEARSLARELGFPVLLKPIDSSHGRGISGRLDDEAAVERAWPIAREYGRRVVVERFVEGRDHRVLVVDGRVVAVAERVPAHVVGNGRSSIAEPIEIETRDPRRGIGHRTPLTLLQLGEPSVERRGPPGRTPATVPAPGERVMLLAAAN